MIKTLYNFMGGDSPMFKNKQDFLEYVRNCNKPILFTLGLNYKKPTHCREKIESFEAAENIKEYACEAKEYADFIDLHCYTDNDLY